MHKTLLGLAAFCALLAGCGSEGDVTPSVTVISPGGGELWSGGESREITWTSAGGTGRVDVAYTTDGGGSWNFISTDETDDGSYIWAVPGGIASTECLVWVQSGDGRATDTSDATFEIQPFSASPTVEWTADAQTFGEDAGTVTLTATLSAFSAANVVVPFTVSGTASGPADHDLADGNIVITSGNLTGSATFDVVDDSAYEEDETVVVTMGAPAGAGLGTVTVHTVTIADNDDAPTVEWTADSQAAGEASGTVTVAASLSAISFLDVTVPFTVGGTATSPADHDLTDGSINIPAGDVSGSVTFSVVDDPDVEGNETVVLTIGTPAGATAGAVTVHTVTITDNDGVQTVEWSAAAQTVAEDVVSVTVTAVLSAPAASDVTVPFIVSGSAGNPEDHDLADGSIVIAAGNPSGTVTFGVVDDSLDENDEAVVLTMGVPVNAGLGVVTVHTVTITDNDAPPTVEWTAPSQAVGEDAGAVTFTAALSAESGLEVTVPYTVGGTAQSPLDHDLADGSVVIAAGDLTGSVAIGIVDDSASEMDETIVVTMGAPTNATPGAVTVHTVTISDNDLPSVEWSVAAQTVGEGVVTVTVTAALSGLTEPDVTVPFTVSGTAANPADHDLADGSIVIAGGTLTDSVTFNIAGDTLDENDETVVLTMGALVNGVPGTITVHTVTIADDDPSPTVEWTTAAQTTPEAPVSVLVTAVLSELSGRDVTVPFTVGGTAARPDDHDLGDSDLVIVAGDLDSSVTLAVVDDALDEDDETVVLTIGVPTGADPGAVTVHTVTITDDDPMPRIEWTVPSQTVGEDVGTVTLTAALSAPSGRDVSAPYTVGGSASNPDDHDLAAGGLLIAAGSVSVPVTFGVIDDSDAEPNETVTLTIGVPTSASRGATTVHTVTITDDDSDWDVTVTAVSGPAAANLGEVIAVDNTVRNDGANDTGSFRVGIYLSDDAVVTTSDMLMGTRVVATLAGGGGTSADSTPAAIPAGLPLGTYFIGAIADDLDALPETNEANNAMASAGTIDVTAPDLVMTALSGPASANQGDNIDLDDTVENVGAGDAGGFGVRFYLSTNDSISPDFDRLLGARLVAGLGAALTDSATTTVTVPLGVPAGTYFIGGIVDARDDVAESDETNNTFVSAGTIDIGAAPGWDVYEPDNVYADATPIAIDGATQDHNLHSASDSDWLEITVSGPMTIVIETSAITGGANTYLTLYAADGTTVLIEDDDGGAAPWASRIVWTFAAATTCYVEVTHAWPFGSPGGYTIAVTSFAIGADVDIVAQNVNAWPQTVLAGSSVIVNLQVQNAGGDDSASFRVGIYMSDDATVTVADALVDTVILAGLVAGDTYWSNKGVTIPPGTPSADYWFGMIADDLDSVAETDETNNVVVAVNATGVDPDVAVTVVSVPGAAGEGDTIDIDHTIHNDGGCSLYNIRVRIFLSRDAEIDETSDMWLGNRMIAGPFAGGANDAVALSVTLPAVLDPGTWYIGVVTFLSGMGPGWGPETDYTDNIMTDTIVITGTGAPDLVVTSLAASPLVVAPGNDLDVDVVTVNVGSISTLIATETGIYLSVDPEMMFGPFWKIGFRAVPILGGGASDAASITLTIPGGPGGVPGGTYYLVARADDGGAVAESFEQNNALAAAERVSVMAPDSDEPQNNSRSGGAFLSWWMPPQPCTFHVPGDVDWFRLSAGMPGTYTVETSDLRLGADTVIELYLNADETPVMIDDDGASEPGASKLTFDMDFMNQYFLRVTHASGGTGLYMIQLRQGQ